MKVTVKWLKELVDFDLSTAELVEMLDLSGTKVEATNSPGDKISGVVVAEVLNVEAHPNADNLSLVDVRAADGATQRVVCGAKNFSVGDRVPLARVGARLPQLTITERKIRGETSAGMLCSGMELGVSRDHSGILVLPQDATLGEDVVETLGLDDTILELEITLNRPDCMSMLGVAREIAALTGNPLKVPAVGLVGSDDVEAPMSVTIEDARGCPRYVARYVEGVTVGPAPGWMASRLVACGVRPVSNIVDVTNYVLLELGQPLHAFDAARIAQRSIVVRRARRNERMTTLDGVERELHVDDLLIADPRGPLAIAGVMGGGESEVSAATTDVIIESAYFDPTSIAFTARRHLMRTEASARFERGMDPAMAPVAAARAAQLMVELAGGRASSTVVDEYPRPLERARIRLRPTRTNKLLGIDISPEEQARSLRSIELEVDDATGVLDVRVPTFRPDLTREVDLVEEVGRLHGFHELPSTLPPGRAGGLTRIQLSERALRHVLVGFGVFDAWTPSLISERDIDRLQLEPDHPAHRMVKTWNPMTEDEAAMRTTLLPSLLKAVAHNHAHGVGSIALFEIAKVYEPALDELPREAQVVAAVLAGSRRRRGWNERGRNWDFFAAKGVIEAMLSALGVDEATFAQGRSMPFHPTRAASVSIGGTLLGVIGEIHPDVCDAFEVPPGAVAFELALAPVLAALPDRVRAVAPPRFPAVLIDLAVVVDESVPAESVRSVIREAGAPELVSARLFDVYQGDQVPDGRKSLAFALELRDPERTLTDEDAVAVRDRILPALRERTGADLRG